MPIKNAKNDAANLNPQARQMADESMVRNLDAQARAIWPQEIALLRRYKMPRKARILDAGAGTGEGSSRLAKLFPQASVLGVDILDAHLELARARYVNLAPRLRFEHHSIFELGLRDRSFDLVVCRHVVHSIPYPERVLGELARVARKGGYMHLIPEDYGMLHFQRAEPDPRDFWHIVPPMISSALGTDLFIGRNIFTLLSRMNFERITMDYIVVDTLRVERSTFAAILEAWRDGYVDLIGERTSISRESAVAYFDRMIRNVRDPHGYALWMVPVVSARVPRR